jgi:thymidylate synthase|nr:MAG TPA: hypothetical protein [Caudoviricetes sp.]
MNRPMDNLSLHKQYNTFFDEQYISLLRRILNEGYIEYNNRTKTEIKALPQRTLVFNLINHVPVVGARKIFPHVAAAELAWTLQGTQDTTFIKKYSKMWTQFEDEPNKVVTAYGYRWRTQFKRDQLMDAIEALKKDRSNRQVWVTAWDAAQDGLLNIGKYKNMPCIIGFMLNTIGNKLNMTVVIRSSDTVVGLPYDTMMYAFLLCALAKSIGVPTGKIFIVLSHAHIYSAHYELVQRMISSYEKYTLLKRPIDQEFVPQSIPIPQHSVEQILAKPDLYVEEIKQLYTHSLDRVGLKPKLDFPDVIQ